MKQGGTELGGRKGYKLERGKRSWLRCLKGKREQLLTKLITVPKKSKVGGPGVGRENPTRS